jgi:hypothetical protein
MCSLPQSVTLSDRVCENVGDLEAIIIGLNKTGSPDNKIHSLYIDWARIYKDNSSIIFSGEQSKSYRLFLNTWMDDSGRMLNNYGSYHAPDSTINLSLGAVSRQSIEEGIPTSRKVFYVSSERKLLLWPMDIWLEINDTVNSSYIGVTDENNNLLPTQYIEKNGTDYRIAFLATVEKAKKFFFYYDLNKTVKFDFETDLSYDNTTKTVENSYFYWDFDDNIFKFKGSSNWFVTGEWMSFNGTQTSYSLSNWQVLDYGPARVRMSATALNINYNITVFAYSPLILVEPYGPEHIDFGPVWSINGDPDSTAYLDKEYSVPKSWDYRELSLSKYSWFGKRDETTALVVFAEKDKAYPSSSTFEAGGNYTYVEVVGDRNPKVYFMPDDFLFWDYEDVRKDLETKPRFSESIFVIESTLAGQDLNIASEKI